MEPNHWQGVKTWVRPALSAGLGFVALSCLWFMASSVVTWVGMRSWAETSAVVEDVGLSRRGGEQLIYRVSVAYRYSYDGASYAGSRVDIGSYGLNLDRFYLPVHETLLARQEDGVSIPCFVNPKSPSDSVLYRDLRWGILLEAWNVLLVFGYFAWTIGSGSIRRFNEARNFRALEDAHPDTPWKWRKEWTEGVVSLGDGELVGVALRSFVLIVLFLATVTIDIAYQRHYFQQGIAGPWVGFLVLYSILESLFVAASIYVLRSRFLYGDIDFRIEGPTGVLGGALRGILEIPKGLTRDQTVVLSLRCHVHGAKDGNRKTETIWTSEYEVDGEDMERLEHGGARVPVYFAIPEDLPESDPGPGRKRAEWTISARSKRRGGTLRAGFTVPVFYCEAGDGVDAPDLGKREAAAAPEKPAKTRSRAALIAEHGGMIAFVTFCFVSGLAMTVPALWAWQDVRGWEEVPAIVEFTKGAPIEDSDAGDLSLFRYGYTYNGVAYTSGSFYPMGFNDVWSDLNHVDLLRDWARSGESIPCYVNPDKPGQAVVFRGLTGGLYRIPGVCIFGGVFLAVVIPLLNRREQERGFHSAVLQEDAPGGAWRVRADWRAGVVESHWGERAIEAMSFTWYWYLVAIPAAVLGIREVLRGDGSAWGWVAVAPIVGDTGRAPIYPVVSIRWCEFTADYIAGANR